jgi:hypothetical protein
MPSHNAEAKGDYRSWGAAESAKAGLTYCFMLLSLCTRVRRQSTTFGFYRFDKSLSSFLGPAPITTTITTHSDTKPAARRAPTCTAAVWFSGGIRSLYIQQHCARIQTYLLLGACFVAEGPVRRNTFERSTQKQSRSYHPGSFGIVTRLKTKGGTN